MHSIACMLTLLAAGAAAADVGDCGGRLSAASGTLEFNRDSGIPVGLWCTWRISPAEASKVTITFESMDLNSRGPDSCKQPLLFAVGDDAQSTFQQTSSTKNFMLCTQKRKILPPSMEIEVAGGSTLYIFLGGVFSGNGKGFKLNYQTTAVPPAACEEGWTPMWAEGGKTVCMSGVFKRASNQQDARSKCNDLGAVVASGCTQEELDAMWAISARDQTNIQYRLWTDLTWNGAEWIDSEGNNAGIDDCYGWDAQKYDRKKNNGHCAVVDIEDFDGQRIQKSCDKRAKYICVKK